MDGQTEVNFIPQKCPVCNGFGTLKYGQKTCQACQGLGYVVIDNNTGLPVDRRKEGLENED